MNKLSFLSSVKIPEFIREEYPALITFVNAYYRYLETLQSLGNIGDVDEESVVYLKLHKDTVAKGFDEPEYLSIRKFILANKDFFSRKGTNAAFEFFFKAYFGETIEIRTPNYLIASGGEIIGNYYFYVMIDIGTITEGEVLQVETDSGFVNLDVIRVELLDSGTYGVFFKPPRGFVNQVGDVCRIYNSSNALTFRGTIKKTPFKILPVVPGKYWQLGQVIVLPPTSPGGEDTIARVSRTTPDGGIAAIEIIKFGYPQTAQQYTISSFDAKPRDTIDFSELEEVESTPGIFTYTLTVNDTLLGITDTVNASQVFVGGAGYFSETYQAEDYSGEVVLAQSNALPNVGAVSADSVEYLESLATLKIERGPIARERFVYDSEKSLISNQNTALHDNLFYQAFAYSIETTQTIDKYRGSIDLIHPAGMKFSAVLNKLFEEDINTELSIESSGFPNILGVSSTASLGTIRKTISLPLTGISRTLGIGSLSI
jgi:hypothetical protein